MFNRKGALLSLSLLLTAPLAVAHHSTANFDQTKEQTITGVVSYFAFTNPHSYIDLEATADPQSGKAEPYKVFAPGRVLLIRYDWLLPDLKAGDKVTITGAPDRKDPHFMYLKSITFASGKVWQRSQQIPE
ncbi:MAG: hypothetical protein EOP08_09075 [Proteobacteria bacterium]|nr:MAG: hypothetical protein EOP08_09075 [Pseudomonadota bacterium]